jgi:hypothetical protein
MRSVLEGLEGRRLLAAGDIEWLHQFGSAGAPLADAAQAADADGNVYVAGNVAGFVSGQPSAGGQDAFLRKYDAAGNELWTRQFGSSGADSILGITVDASGVYVTGSAGGALAGQTGAGNLDVFLRKYDLDGVEQWTRQFGTPQADLGSAVAVDASGVYVTGRTSGSLPGFTAAGNSDAFLRKYGLDGTELWTRQFGTFGFDTGFGVASDGAGVYLAGQVESALPGQTSNIDGYLRRYDALGNETWTRLVGTAGFDQAVSVAVHGAAVYVVGGTASTGQALPGQISSGGGDAYLRKYDTSGNESWTRQWGSPTLDTARGVAADDSGVYVAGDTAGVLAGQVSAGSPDAFLRMYDSEGNEGWTRQFGTAGTDRGWGVSADPTGVYIVGAAGGDLPGQSGAGAGDGFVRKYGATGAEVWTRQFGSHNAAHDVASGMDADGNVYIAGWVFGQLPGLSTAGGLDAFVRKYDAAGNLVWTRQFGGLGNDQVEAIVADASGVYVAGRTDFGLPGHTPLGGDDAFVRRYDSDGNEIWTRQFGTATLDQAFGVAVHGSALYVTGRTFGAFPGGVNAGGLDGFLRKYDLNGNDLWTQQFGTAASDSAFAVAAGGSGVYVGGMTEGAFDGEVNAGFHDAFLSRYDEEGSLVWTRQFGTQSLESVEDLDVSDSGVFLVGRSHVNSFVKSYDAAGEERWSDVLTQLILDVDVHGSSVFVAGADSVPGLGDEAYVREYTTAGDASWSRSFGTARTEILRGITASAAGLFVTGTTEGAFPGHLSAGNFDVFVARLSDPPEVLAVDVGPDLHSILVQLNDDDLEAASAGDTANYTVLAGNGDGDGDGDPFNDGDELAVALTWIGYDPGADLITLRTSVPLFNDVFKIMADGDGPASDGTTGLRDLADDHLSGGDFAAELDLRGLTMLADLVGKVEAMGLSTSAEGSLTARLRAAAQLMEMEVGEETGVLRLLDAFQRGVVHWFDRGQLTLGQRDELLLDSERIELGILLTG